MLFMSIQVAYILYRYIYDVRKSLWASGYRNGFAHHMSRVQEPVGTVHSNELATNYNQDSIKLSVRWCVWKVGEGFHGRVLPKILKWLAMYSSVTFHIKGLNRDRSAPCLYIVTGWGVMSCVCSMAFLCGSTLVKVPLLQAGTVVI